MFSNTALFASMMALGADASLRGSRCPDYTRQENFDLLSYTGLWYEQVRDAGTIFEIGADCVTARYTANADGTVRVRNNSHYPIVGWTGTTAKAYDTVGEDGDLFVSFNGKAPGPDAKSNYSVLATDYDNFAIVYNCSDFKVATTEVLWILGREPVMDADVLKQAEAIIAEKLPSYDMSKKSYYTKQGDKCPYDSQPE